MDSSVSIGGVYNGTYSYLELMDSVPLLAG